MFSAKNYPKTRNTYARASQVSGVLIIAGGIFFSLTLSNIPPAVAFSISIGLGLLLLYLADKALNRLLYIPKSLYIRPSEVDNWVNSWTQWNGPIAKMLPTAKCYRLPTRRMPRLQSVPRSLLIALTE
ncbi:MAG: hypothetical protein GDA48_15190 [Hormoscilla sp. GM102CHS1]|nr:hypothetical protein [Hormoscilla sp. GM102CHS1]